MKTPYEKYNASAIRLWEKFKITIRNVCEHPPEHVKSVTKCEEDEYGCTNYNRGIITHKCNYCGKMWSEEWVR